MSFESLLRTDLLDPGLLKNPQGIKVAAQTQFDGIINKARVVSGSPQKTPGNSKNIIEVMDLIRQAILDYQDRTNASEDSKIDVVYEEPDKAIDLETISMSFEKRLPGAFSQGKPMEGNVANQRPVLRELEDDPDNPGYKRAVLGYFYDNILNLTAWARTNKEANKRALWIESVMEEYTWFFRISGVNRILFHGWEKNRTLDINGNKYYGRPIHYFVRTEKLWNVSQKILEEILIKVAATT